MTATAAAAAPRAVPAEKYGADLEELCAEFPDFDRMLMEDMLEDQGGDVRDVRAMLRVGAWGMGPCD